MYPEIQFLNFSLASSAPIFYFTLNYFEYIGEINLFEYEFCFSFIAEVNYFDDQMNVYDKDNSNYSKTI